jgi:CheY-like chemotaxis protein
MQLRVLIVDDNEAFLDAARALLERQGLSVVGVASTSADALERAEQLQPNVMLVDITLGDESGFELARRVAARGRRASRGVDLDARAGGLRGSDRRMPRQRFPGEV